MIPEQTNKNFSYYPGIDVLRGVLVIYVFCFHAFIIHQKLLPDLVFQIISFGHYSVQVFFMISGFLIAMSFGRIEASGLERTLVFLKKRFLRIYPVYFISVLVFWCFTFYSMKILLTQFTFLFGFFMYDDTYLPNAVAWTLFNEEVFYLLAMLCLPFISSLRSVGLFLFVCVVQYLWKTYAIQMGIPETNYFISRFFLSHLSFFFGGVLIFHFKDLFVRWSAIALYAIPLLMVVLILSGANFDLRLFFISTFSMTLALSNQRWTKAIFELKVIQWIGKRCYFIYLFQLIPIGFLRQIEFESGVTLYSSHLIAFFVLSLMAQLSWKYLELPLIKRSRS